MDTQRFKKLMYDGAAALAAAKDKLCAIDAETGDGDHGITMAKVAEVMMRHAEDPGDESPGAFLAGVSAEVMTISGGSASPLCALIIEGMGKAAGEAAVLDPMVGKALFQGAVDGLRAMSTAQPGEKTMLDPLLAAAQAAQATQGNTGAILAAAAAAAQAAAEDTRNMVAKFGRAKNLGAESLGHLDAGAVSIATFISAVNRSYINSEAKGDN